MRTLNWLVVLLTHCCLHGIHAQNNYLVMRDTLYPKQCGIPDSMTLAECYRKVLELDTSSISPGIGEYYKDLSNLQYDLFLYNSTDTSWLQLAFDNVERALKHLPDDLALLWNAGFFANYLGDCPNSTHYLNRYIQACPRKYRKRNRSEIRILLSRCLDWKSSE